MSAVGIVVAVAGLLTAARSAQLLRGRGRPKRGPRPAFVIAGPYVRVRNPMFGGLIVLGAGLAIAAGSVLLAVGTTAAAGVAHMWVTRVEEPRLRERFGPAYEAYLAAVPRWLPARARSHPS